MNPNEQLKPGDRVTYVPVHGKPEIGIVKRINEHSPGSVFVVYNCDGEWSRYQDFTAASTNVRNLIKGWTI